MWRGLAASCTQGSMSCQVMTPRFCVSAVHRYLDAAAGEVLIQKLTVRNGACSALPDDRDWSAIASLCELKREGSLGFHGFCAACAESLQKLSGNGAGFKLVQSPAKLRDIHISCLDAGPIRGPSAINLGSACRWTGSAVLQPLPLSILLTLNALPDDV